LHVVVLQKDNLAEKFLSAGYLDDVFDQSLSAAIIRMRFAGIYKLYGIFLIINDFRQAVEVGKQEVCPFVGRETAAEPEQQCIGVDAVEDGDYFRRVALVFQPVFAVLRFDVIDEFLFKRPAYFPNLVVG